MGDENFVNLDALVFVELVISFKRPATTAIE